MGWLYLVIGPVMGISITAILDIAGSVGNVSQNGTTVNVGALTGSILAPFGALAAIIVAVPVFYLFVYDKNAGVLEYLLAVGMSQRDIFKGYLKAAWMLSLLVMIPMILLNLAISPSGVLFAAATGGITLIAGISDVAFVTVLMTSFSSMQRKPTGMNSPLGVGVGIIPLFPGIVLSAIIGGIVLWFDFAIAIGLLIIAASLLFIIDRLIRREKLLP